MLKYCNYLSGNIDVQSTLNQAQILYLTFKRVKNEKYDYLSENLKSL